MIDLGRQERKQGISCKVTATIHVRDDGAQEERLALGCLMKGEQGWGGLPMGWMWDDRELGESRVIPRVLP